MRGTRTAAVVLLAFIVLTAGPGNLRAGLGGYGDALLQARREAMKVKSRANLHQIGIAVQIWLHRHGEGKYFPPSLAALLEKKLFNDPRVFLHPASGTKLEKDKFVSDYDSALDRADFPLAEGMMPSSLMLAWEKTSIYGDGRNVVFFNGSATFVSEKEFEKLLKKLDAALSKHRPKPPKKEEE